MYITFWWSIFGQRQRCIFLCFARKPASVIPEGMTEAGFLAKKRNIHVAHCRSHFIEFKETDFGVSKLYAVAQMLKMHV